MRRVILCITGVLLLAGGQITISARPSSHDSDVSLYGPTFQAGGLKFTVPSRWQSEPADNPARVGQWHVPLPHGAEGEGGEVVVFYFGRGVGGSAKENIAGWAGTMTKADHSPATTEVKSHETGGLKISQVVIFGTYKQPVPLPGVPPQYKSNYGLLGAVIESPQGNIYWHFTGPAALVTASEPLFNKIIDSVKPQDK